MLLLEVASRGQILHRRYKRVFMYVNNDHGIDISSLLVIIIARLWF